MSVDFWLGALAGVGFALIASWAWDRTRSGAAAGPADRPPLVEEHSGGEPPDPEEAVQSQAQADALLRRAINRGTGGV